jgi:hypothetical protein
MTSAQRSRHASLRHIVPFTPVSRDCPFRAAKVSCMRTEPGSSATGKITNCSGCLDDFTDEARLEKVDRLRKSLAENSYHISAADVAVKVIEYMLRF